MLVDGLVGVVDPKRLCAVCSDLTGTAGASIMLMIRNVPGGGGSVGTTGDLSAFVDQLQFGLGEGPGVDASRYGRPVIEPDLARPATPRWPAFAGAAVEAGVRAVFAFPLKVGAAPLGAVNLYRERPGPLTDDQHADGLVTAEVIGQTLLALQADAPPGALAAELESGGDFRYVVHQASGMVAAQLQVSVGHALIRLRAYAFGNEQPLHEVAQRVVARTLRFDRSNGELR